METRSLSLPASVTPNNSNGALLQSPDWKQSLPQVAVEVLIEGTAEMAQAVTPETAEQAAMQAATTRTITLMHVDFTHSQPNGISMDVMVQRWAERFTKAGVPHSAISQLYDTATERRRRNRDNPHLSNYMPSVDNLIAEWEIICLNFDRDQNIEADRIADEKRVHHAESAPKTGALKFDALLAEMEARKVGGK